MTGENAGPSATGLEGLRTLMTEEVAEILGVRPEAVRLWVREGILRGMKWGRRLRIRPENVRAFQDAQEVQVPDPRDVVRHVKRRGRQKRRAASAKD